MRDHGVLETGSVWQGHTDHRKVDPHMLGHSSDRHRVHHKHRSDQCNVGWQMKGQHRELHHRDDFHKGGHRRDGHHMGDQGRDGLCTDHHSGHRTADLGKDCMTGHNKDRHRVEQDDGGTQVPPTVSSRWTGLVCTQ